MPEDHQNQIASVLDLLQEATSKEVVQEFLRKKGLRFSGTWPELREKRLIPYLQDYTITLEELIDLVSRSEECGDQHIFLFHCTPADAAAMMDRARIEASLRSQNLAHLIGGRDIGRTPSTPTVVEVRFEPGAQADSALVIKVAEVRTRRKLERARAIFGKYVKVYSDEQVRAVNVAKLHRAGFLELRIQSRDNTNKYDGDLTRFIRQINQFFPFSTFGDTSLTKAKDVMWERREELKELIRYTDACVVDVYGNQVKAVTGSEQGNLSDGAVAKSVDFVLEEDEDAYCAESNLWFLKSEHLAANIHVLLNGATNEFAITRKCSAADYEYVLNYIRHFNR